MEDQREGLHSGAAPQRGLLAAALISEGPGTVASSTARLMLLAQGNLNDMRLFQGWCAFSEARGAAAAAFIPGS